MARRGRKLVPIDLTAEERETLGRFVRRRKTAQQRAQRSRVILLCGDGRSNREVATKLGLHETTVCKWRRRFVEKRLAGLLDEPRPGAPRKVSDETVETIVTTTLESTPHGATHWSTRDLAAHIGVSPSPCSSSSLSFTASSCFRIAVISASSCASARSIRPWLIAL